MERFDLKAWKLIEPAKNCRFIIKLTGTDIPEYLFRKYKIHNEGEELIFTTEFYETVNYTFNPADFFNIVSVDISYLDPTGEVHNGLTFNIKGSNFKKIGDYSDIDNLTTIKLRFVIDVKTIKLKYTNK
jgi:hypothetical protein